MENWKEFLEQSIGDAEAIEKLRLWMGALLNFGSPAPSRMLILVGHYPSANGVFLNLLCYLVGSVRCARVSPLMLEQKMMLEVLDECRLNIGDEEELFSPVYEDLSHESFNCVINTLSFMSWVKQLLGQYLIVVSDVKSKRPYGFMPQCALAGSCSEFFLHGVVMNDDPEMASRLLLIPTHLEADALDPDLLNTLKAEGDQIAAWAFGKHLCKSNQE